MLARVVIGRWRRISDIDQCVVRHHKNLFRCMRRIPQCFPHPRPQPRPPGVLHELLTLVLDRQGFEGTQITLPTLSFEFVSSSQWLYTVFPSGRRLNLPLTAARPRLGLSPTEQRPPRRGHFIVIELHCAPHRGSQDLNCFCGSLDTPAHNLGSNSFVLLYICTS